MTTAGVLIRDSLQEALVESAEQPLGASETQLGIRYLNDLMADYAVRGINLGYTEVSDLGDEITVPSGALRGMRLNLAMELITPFDISPVPVDLPNKADNSLRTLRKLSIGIGAACKPSTLPIGSGNEDNGRFNDYFYSEETNQILDENNDFIVQESGNE
jgi:hypothetical protein